MEAEAGAVLPAPFWATAWPGGQAVARHVLDRAVTVAGRRVLDVASGSGLVAIAARLAGAAAVMANDIDSYALGAITLNARANGVAVSACPGDLLDGDGGDADVVLAGDVFYSEAIAKRMWPFLHRAAARGAHVLVGDRGRGSASGPDEDRGKLPGGGGRCLGGAADQPEERVPTAMTSRVSPYATRQATTRRRRQPAGPALPTTAGSMRLTKRRVPRGSGSTIASMPERPRPFVRRRRERVRGQACRRSPRSVPPPAPRAPRWLRVADRQVYGNRDGVGGWQRQSR